MDLRQAYKILEIPENSSMSQVQQAYRDLSIIWHPDHYTSNERLQKKASQKMKELNAARDCIVRYFKAEDGAHLNEKESKHAGSEETITVCPKCGTKNRTPSSVNRAEARCGRCGDHLFPEKQKKQSEDEWGQRTLCGDGTCIGIIDSTGKCTKCGRTYEEGVAAEKIRNQQQNKRKRQSYRKKVIIYVSAVISKLQSHRKKVIIYGSVVIGFVLLFLLPNQHSTPTQQNPSFTPPPKLEVPIDSEPVNPTVKPPPNPEAPIDFDLVPVNPNRLSTGSVPFTGGIRSGHSQIAVDNGTDTDAIVRVIRFNDAGQQKIRNFYVRSRDKFIAKQIPPGEYVLKVAFGTDWNSDTRKFNYRKSFSKTQTFTIEETKSKEQTDEGEVEHTRFSELSITLHKVLHGNFKSSPINEEEFWQ